MLAPAHQRHHCRRRLPGGAGHQPEPRQRHARERSAERCTAAWKRTVGGDTTSQHTSLLGLAYYLPNQEDLSKGARWYRCDLVAGGQDGLPLQNLPAKVDGLLDGAVPQGIQACRTTPDFNSGHTVPCSEDHVLRAIGTFPLPGKTYPGTAALRAASAGRLHPRHQEVAARPDQRRRRLPVAGPDRLERRRRPHCDLLDGDHALTGPASGRFAR